MKESQDESPDWIPARLTKPEEHQIPRVDWDFDDVPESELAVCCLWEYARESAYIRAVRESTAARTKFDLIFNGLGRAAILFQEGIYGFDGDNYHAGFVSPFPKPWRAISKADRAILLETAQWNPRKFLSVAGVRRLHPCEANVLLTRLKLKPPSKILSRKSIRRLLTNGISASRRKPREMPRLISSSGREMLCMEINWRDFTNKRIAQHFIKWLKENQPTNVERPDRRGQKQISIRVKLERLAVLRLLHQCTPAELPAKHPQAWEHYSSVNRRWRKDAENARQHFREYFPFLPATDEILAWPPKSDFAE